MSEDDIEIDDLDDLDDDQDDPFAELEEKFEQLVEKLESGEKPEHVAQALKEIDEACDDEIEGLKTDLESGVDEDTKNWLQEELEAFQDMKSVVEEIRIKIGLSNPTIN